MTAPGAAARRASDALWAALARPDSGALFVVLYCGFHLIARVALSPVFSLDEAEQVLFSQSLQWGYRFRHPPLVTWLTYAAFWPLGAGRIALFAMKYAVMAAGLLAYFAAARRALGDDRLALLALLGLLFTFVMGFLPHQDLMHTVLLASMLAIFLWAALRVVQDGRWSDYLWLGAAIGFGLLSKYVFAVAVAGMALGVACTPRLRTRIEPLALLGALALAALIVAPYAWWAAVNEHSLLALAGSATKGAGAELDPIAWFAGMADLVVALAGFAVPFVVVFAALFWRSFLRLPETVAPGERALLRLFEIAMLVGAMLMLGAVFLIGAESFKPRWMHQVLMPLPIYLVLRAKLAGATQLRFKLFALFAVLFVLGAFAARFAIYETHIERCKSCREYLPMANYARSLARAGFLGGTIVADEAAAIDDFHLAGNIRAYFPESRVATPGYPPSVFGKPKDGQCLAIWLGEEKSMPPALTTYLADALQAAPDENATRGRIETRLDKSASRTAVLNFLLMPQGKGDCR